MIIERRQVVEEPYYVRVPPGHRKNWKRYCGQYGACGRPVYFVDNRWYNDVYVPQYRERERGHGGHDDHDNHGRGDDNDQGRGRGHGKGRGHGGGHGDH